MTTGGIGYQDASRRSASGAICDDLSRQRGEGRTNVAIARIGCNERERPFRRSWIFSAGTTLAEVPPDHRGVSFDLWWNQNWLTWWKEWHLATPKPTSPAPITLKPVATKRDNYGWRSL